MAVSFFIASNMYPKQGPEEASKQGKNNPRCSLQPKDQEKES